MGRAGAPDRAPLGAGGEPPRNAPPSDSAPEASAGLLRVAALAVGAARLVARAVPAGVKKRVEDGIFHYIFQKTRVENDNYGWRPSSPGGGEPPPGFGPAADPPRSGR